RLRPLTYRGADQSAARSGQGVAMFCAQCGASLRPDARFCPSCGASVVAGGEVSPHGTPGYTSSDLGVRYAGVWIRFGSLLIAGIILGVVNFIFTAALGRGAGGIVDLAVGAGYYIYSFTQWNGQTVGARAVGIKLVDINGGLVDVNAAAIRWALANVASALFA